MIAPVFFLGVHRPNWLEQTDVPLFVSASTLWRRQTMPKALGSWCLDSRGFNDLREHGEYSLSARGYAALAQRCMNEIGGLVWAAIQDWMCEPVILERTGLTVPEHQRRTIESYLDLRELAPDVPWAPIVQGWTRDDYERHVEAYADAGIDLAALPTIGLGSVCTRQSTSEIARIVRHLHRLGLRLHGFGMKVLGLLRCRDWLASADSMAWSLDGRLPDGGRCARVRDHDRCNNCFDYALRWRQRLIGRLSQLSLGLAA